MSQDQCCGATRQKGVTCSLYFFLLMAGQGQTCSNKEGLNAAKIVDCDVKGQTVQCPNNGMAPLSPRILTCGKLGSYNLDDQYRWPNNIICGGRYCTCACVVPDRIMLHITISLSLSDFGWLPADLSVYVFQSVCFNERGCWPYI